MDKGTKPKEYYRDEYGVHPLFTPADKLHEVGEAGEPTFQNSWANEGGAYANCGFCKDIENKVTLQGRVNGGPDNTIIFALQTGNRPDKTLTFAVVSEAACHIEINANGEVKVVV